MTRYKLIKEYPGSPPLGTTRSAELVRDGRIITDKPSERYDIYPEFWEKVKELEFEILSFICNRNIGDLTKGVKVNKQNFDLFAGYSKGSSVSSTEAKFLQSENWDIHSVKRLSDGEIFTIEDQILLTKVKEYRVISAFSLIGSKTLQIKLKPIKYKSSNVLLRNISKIKIALFKTEDGVEIFEGNTYYSVSEPELNYRILECKCPPSGLKDVREALKHFSTEKAAKNYIKLHKPCLSYSDVWEIINNSKINPKSDIGRDLSMGSSSIKTLKTNLTNLVKTRINVKE